MNLCATCYAPGHCCKNFVLTRNAGVRPLSDRPSHTDALAWAARNDLPFTPVRAEPYDDGTGWYWRFSCTKLRDGRCSIYEDRPYLCRAYAAGSDDLCVHSHGTEAGDPSAPAMSFRGLPPVVLDMAEPWPEEENLKEIAQ